MAINRPEQAMVLELMNAIVPSGYIVGCRWIPELHLYRYAIVRNNPDVPGTRELLGEYDDEDTCLCMCKLLMNNEEWI